MAIAKDILMNSNNDLLFANGDLVVGPSDQQSVTCIINTTVGSFKEFPLVGVGIQYYQASAGQESILKRSINIQLNTDGIQLTRLQLVQTSTEFDYSLAAKRINI